MDVSKRRLSCFQSALTVGLRLVIKAVEVGKSVLWKLESASEDSTNESQFHSDHPNGEDILQDGHQDLAVSIFGERPHLRQERL